MIIRGLTCLKGLNTYVENTWFGSSIFMRFSWVSLVLILFCSITVGGCGCWAAIEVILSSRGGHRTLSVTWLSAGWTVWTVFGQHLVDSRGKARPDPSHTKTATNYPSTCLWLSTLWPWSHDLNAVQNSDYCEWTLNARVRRFIYW